jgi:hypothetical protein
MTVRKPGQPHKGWKSAAKKTLSDGTIYAAVRRGDMSDTERRELDEAVDTALSSQDRT